jgi:L-fucose isomerase-like protein
MKVLAGIFISTRYWDDIEQRKAALEEGKQVLLSFADDVILFYDTDLVSLEKYDANDIFIVVPFSGAVQPSVLRYSAFFKHVCIYAAYVQGNVSTSLGTVMLALNAAPTVMDSYAVIKRKNKNIKLALNEKEVRQFIRLRKAYDTISHSTLLLVGDTEPWVVSASRNLFVYENRLGCKILVVHPDELIGIFDSLEASDPEVVKIKKHFLKACDGNLVEPNTEDVAKASRLAASLLTLLKKYDASGVAVACFNLISLLDTTSCLGLSYINDCTDSIASCEGDIDSLVSLLMMKQLTNDKLWMANPNLQNDRTVNFAHCTAPITVGGKSCNCRLRNHHESKKGVSTEVYLPIGQNLTLFRLGNEAQSVTITTGVSIEGIREETCRTQLRVQLASFEKYLETSLGTHQVIAFEDILQDLTLLSKLFGLEVL